MVSYNRWSDIEANNYIAEYKKKGVNEDLALRTYTARLLGNEPELVIHGGGNTSVKTITKDLFGENINETAFFFWSSENIGKKFTETFGYKWKSKQCCKHFDFCKERNIELIQYHEPKIVIAPGIGDSKYFSNMYEMKHIATIDNDKGDRLIEHFEIQDTPFIFTKHWTSAFGFSKKQQEIITERNHRLDDT